MLADAGLPLLAAAAVVRPEVLLLDSQKVLQRLQRLVTLVRGRPLWRKELLEAVETGRVAQWLVMGEWRATCRCTLPPRALTQQPSDVP